MPVGVGFVTAAGLGRRPAGAFGFGFGAGVGLFVVVPALPGLRVPVDPFARGRVVGFGFVSGDGFGSRTFGLRLLPISCPFVCGCECGQA